MMELLPGPVTGCYTSEAGRGKRSGSKEHEEGEKCIYISFHPKRESAAQNEKIGLQVDKKESKIRCVGVLPQICQPGVLPP